VQLSGELAGWPLDGCWMEGESIVALPGSDFARHEISGCPTVTVQTFPEHLLTQMDIWLNPT